MEEQKKSTSVSHKPDAPQNELRTDIVTPKDGKVKTDIAKRGNRKKFKNKIINQNQSLASLALKFYSEQVPKGFQYVAERIRLMDKSSYQCIGIVHDRDIIPEDFWTASSEKPHMHVIVRPTKSSNRFRVSKLLDYLGVVFRPGIDDSILEHGALETVKDFPSYTLYLTHDTEQAIADGKAQYPEEELISNLDIDEIRQVKAGYRRVSVTQSKVTYEELVSLDADAYKLGYEFGDFDFWYRSQSFAVRSHSKMKTIRESYDMGVADRLREKPDVLRLCIFIKGMKDTGKTYASIQALAGKQFLSVSGGGTGKFDNLMAHHDAIIIDDDVCPNLLNMSDNYVCRAYKRMKNNPAWTGQYLIVTSNLEFEDWVRACGIHTRDYFDKHTEQYNAVRSRFYICQIQYNHMENCNYLALKVPSTRGNDSEQAERLRMFIAFKSLFDVTIANYIPTPKGAVDYDSYIDTNGVMVV